MKAAASLAAILILTLGLAASAEAQPMPPQPGPEHEVLKRNVGVWDGTLEMTFPGGPPMEMTTVETNTLMAGRWLLSDTESEMMGQTFESHGITGWDPAKKAYFAVRATSMGTELTHSETTYDPETNTLSGWVEMPDPTGGMSKVKTVAEWPDEGTRVVKIYGPDGGDEPFVTITYKKRK